MTTSRTRAKLLTSGLLGIVLHASAQPPAAMPHLAHPDQWPQPDYATNALELTSFRPGAAYKALKLRAGVMPELLVLPVQMQVFGWTPSFAALVGAQLDHVVRSRGIRANAQTDLFDVDGPFVRRFEPAAVDAFAREYPGVPILALFVGRDAVDRVFVTLVLRRADKTAVAHRSLKDGLDPLAVASDIDVALSGMLSELGFAKPATTVRPAPVSCDPGDWGLADPVVDEVPVRIACRALIMGTLLPDVEETALADPVKPRTPAKLAWLAQAHVESQALAAPLAQAARALAWRQLELSSARVPVAPWVDVDDPVIRPLARLLFGPERSRTKPVLSPKDALESYAASAAGGLPPFAAAVFRERALFTREFRPADLCAIELELPSMRMPKGCEEAGLEKTARRAPATWAERSLLEEWRLAQGYKSLMIAGRYRGSTQGVATALSNLPPRVADHPFIRHFRLEAQGLDAATGSFDDMVKRSTVSLRDAVQALADVQRLGFMDLNDRIADPRWKTYSVVLDQPSIQPMLRDARRMSQALVFDGFSTRFGSPRLHAVSTPDFLIAGPSLSTPGGRKVDLQATVPAKAGLAVRLPYFPDESDQIDEVGYLERMLVDHPVDMENRVRLAIQRMKGGQTLAQATRLIDEHPTDRRPEQAIAESHAWAGPAHAFFFAGEVPVARRYYEKVARIGTYSGSDLQARVRLRLLDGDIKGAQAQTDIRLARYESDFARRDLAGLMFMQGRRSRAWEILGERLANSEEMELWTGAQVGHRQEGARAEQVKRWITQHDYGHARLAGQTIATVFLARYVTDDRQPTDADIALIDSLAEESQEPGNLFKAYVRLQQLAFAEKVDATSVSDIRDLIGRSAFQYRSFLKPLYAWNARRASVGDDPLITQMKTAPLAADFDSVLAKALILGMEGDVVGSRQFLRAARLELSELSTGHLKSDVRSAEYTVALSAYLLHRQTGNAAYRNDALEFARAYQKVFPFLAWPYALDALLSERGPARTLAGCKAGALDPQSQFLKLARWTNKGCPKTLW